MKKVTRNYVEYMYPGIYNMEMKSKEVDTKDPLKIEYNEHCIAFRLYDKDFIIDNEDEYEGKAKNYSGWFFLGRRYTLDEILHKFSNIPRYETLIENMKDNNYTDACRTRHDNFLPMDVNDVTLDEYKEYLKVDAKVKRR